VITYRAIYAPYREQSPVTCLLNMQIESLCRQHCPLSFK